MKFVAVILAVAVIAQVNLNINEFKLDLFTVAIVYYYQFRGLRFRNCSPGRNCSLVIRFLKVPVTWS